MPQKNLTKSVAWYGIGNLFVRSVSFILLPVYSNLISTAEFGNYALIMSVYAIIAVFYQFGMHGALNKFYIESKSKEKRKLIFSSVLNSIIIIGVLLTAFFILISKNISFLIFGSAEFSTLFNLIFVALFVETVSFYILYLLKTKELSKEAVTYSGIGAILNLILNIILVYYLDLSVQGIILAQLFSASFLLVLLVKVIQGEYIFKIDPAIFKALVKFAYPLIGAGLLSSAVDVADRFILNEFMGRSEVGIYSFAYRIALVMNVFVISFRTAWNPHSLNLFYSNDYKKSFGKTLTNLVAISCIILLVVSLFARYLFRIQIFNIALFNSVYEPGVIIIPLVIIGYIFNGVAAFYYVYPSVSNKSYHILIADLIAFVVNILLNFVFIPRIGIVGAAFATAIAFLCAAMYLFFVSRNVIKVEYQTNRLSVIILSALIFLLIGLNLKNLVTDIIVVIAYLITLQFMAKINIKSILKIT